MNIITIITIDITIIIQVVDFSILSILQYESEDC